MKPKSNKSPYLYKVDMGDFYWYLWSSFPKEEWGEKDDYHTIKVHGITKIDQKKHEQDFHGWAWRPEVKRGQVQDSSALEFLILFGEVIPERVEK